MFFVSKVVGTTEDVQVEEGELIQSDWPRGISYVVSYRWITGIVDSNVTLVTDCVRVLSVRQTFQPVSPTSTIVYQLVTSIIYRRQALGRRSL
jgi:hypothetical protein